MSAVGASLIVCWSAVLWIALHARRLERSGRIFRSPLAVFATRDPVSGLLPVGQSELGSSGPAVEQRQPELVAPPSRPVPRRTAEGSLALALLAGTAVAFAGGLLWAGVVIATRHDIGYLAWLVGAGTGATVCRVSGAPVRGVPRVVTGLIAACAIVVGKYVIFVHDVRHGLGAVLAQRGISVGYLDSRQMSVFVHDFTTIVRPVYGLWALLALVAALLTAEARSLRRAGRP